MAQENPRLILTSLYGAMGAACFFLPRQILLLGFRPQANVSNSPVPKFDALHEFLLSAFGASTLLQSLTLGTTELGPAFYRSFGLATIPFFTLHAWYTFVHPMFNKWVGLDVAKGSVVAYVCYLAATRSP